MTIMNTALDFLKGSYYANPIIDVPTATEEQRKRYPVYCQHNIWPKDDLPELEDAFKDLGQFIVQVGKLVARAIDAHGL